MIEQAAALSPGREIRAADVQPEHLPAGGRGGSALTLAQAVEDAERRTIEATLIRCGNDLGRVARELGVSGTTLWRRMKRLGLEARDLLPPG
jgi:two-component system response regulator HydG